MLPRLRGSLYRSYRRSTILGQWLTSGRSLPQSLQVGDCPICEHRTLFIKTGAWLRDHYHCAFCLSIPRFRALIFVVQQEFPDWKRLRIHESSPSGAASDKLSRESPAYVGSNYYPEIPIGRLHRGFRCEDLQRQSFADESFDLVITQDVFEHVMTPALAFREIERTLRPGGAHIFTVPLYPRSATVRRAHLEGSTVVHDLPPDYHQNPVDQSGSLVVHEWGQDLPGFIASCTSLDTKVVRASAPRYGIVGEFTEVIVSRKRAR